MRLWGEARQRDGGTEGQRDSCPLAGAGRDRHAPQHTRASDLAVSQLADAGICRRHRALPAPPFAGVLAGTMAPARCKGGLLFKGFGFFLLLFISPLSFGIHLSCPCPSDTQVSTSKCCSLLLSPSTNPPTQNRVRKLGFRWKWPVRGDKVGLQRERVISLTCLVSLHPFKPTYKSNEGADRDKARATQRY